MIIHNLPVHQWWPQRL